MLRVTPGKRDSPYVIKVRVCRQGDHPGLPSLTQHNHRGLYKRKQEVRFREGDAMKKSVVGVLHSGDGGRSHKPWNAEGLQKLEKTGKTVL